jgi:hypothetical protein
LLFPARELLLLHAAPHRTHLEGCVAQQVRHSSAVVQVEVCDERNVYLIKVFVGQEWQAVLALHAWVNAAVKHDALAPAM